MRPCNCLISTTLPDRTPPLSGLTSYVYVSSRVSTAVMSVALCLRPCTLTSLESCCQYSFSRPHRVSTHTSSMAF